MDINLASELQDIIDQTFLVVKDPIAQGLYEKQRDSFWVANELDHSRDRADYNSLPQDERDLIKGPITFFLIADSIVAQNATELTETAENASIARFYHMQAAIEDVHNESYSNMAKCLFDSNIESYIQDIMKRPSIVKKSQFARDSKNSPSLIDKVFTFACIEGVFFSTSFAIMMWLKRDGKCVGITKGNEFIMRDEEFHWRFACHRIKTYFPEFTIDQATKILNECVKIEYDYCDEILPRRIGELSPENLKKHVDHMASRIMLACGFTVKLVETPLQFADMTKMTIRNNFFEGRNSNYTRSIGTFKFDPDYYTVK